MKVNGKVGILSFHGDVVEHLKATESAAEKLHLTIQVVEVRTKEALDDIQALIIPGGESTVLHKLSIREGMFESMKKIPFIFGTCAGAILLAKNVRHKAPNQETLERMDITVDRNAYGRQTESFEKKINTTIGPIDAIFIRAPKIISVGKGVTILAKDNNNILACEQASIDTYSLALSFHPELTTTKFHEYFLRKVAN